MGKGKPCPNCGVDLTGEPIPEEHRHWYGSHTHFDRTIGIEIFGVYDGILFWQCPDCGHNWHRWQDEQMRNKAEPYMNTNRNGPRH